MVFRPDDSGGDRSPAQIASVSAGKGINIAKQTIYNPACTQNRYRKHNFIEISSCRNSWLSYLCPCRADRQSQQAAMACAEPLCGEDAAVEENDFVKPNEQSQTCLSFAMARTFVQVRAEAKLAWIVPNAAESLKAKNALLRTLTT